MKTVTLLIDKRKELSTKYKKLLKTKTNDCIIARNLISAMKTIQDWEPDLIIISDSIDTNLSDYCKKIRALTYDTRPIIIALSKSDDMNDKLEVLKSGADDFISEPIMNEEFMMRIYAHLRRELESNLNEKKTLPARNYSMRALKRMISSKESLSAALISIDNFQNYKDLYTELASDKLLQTYQAIIKSTLEENDFIGQIKEDEFLLITSAENIEAIANYLIYAFETVSSKFYSLEDNKRGYLMLQGDDMAGRRINFVHTTIGVIKDAGLHYKNSAQLYNALSQIHKMAKMSANSNYLIERPQISGEITEGIRNLNKIAICESDEALKVLLKTIFELQGYETVLVNNPSELDIPPALWILDSGVGCEMNGLKFCSEIKQEPKTANTKVILTSIHHDKESALDCGADLYLPKPYEISALVKWVEELLK